jgi:hypothetical protein
MNMVSTNCEEEKAKRTEINQSIKSACLFGSDDIIFKYQRLNSCLVLNKTDSCTLKYPNTHTEDNKCVCDSGYSLSTTGCTLTPSCPENSYLGSDRQCRCNTGFIVKNNQCIFPNNTPISTTTETKGILPILSQPTITPTSIKNLVVSEPKKQKEVPANSLELTTTSSKMFLKDTLSVLDNSKNTEPKKSFFSRVFQKITDFFNFFGF